MVAKYIYIVQMVFSTYTKLRIVHFQRKGYKPYTIANLMKENDSYRGTVWQKWCMRQQDQLKDQDPAE